MSIILTHWSRLFLLLLASMTMAGCGLSKDIRDRKIWLLVDNKSSFEVTVLFSNEIGENIQTAKVPAKEIQILYNHMDSCGSGDSCGASSTGLRAMAIYKTPPTACYFEGGRIEGKGDLQFTDAGCFPISARERPKGW